MSYDPNDAKSIFLQAAELPSSAERAAFLEQACAGKPGLKARVESLLKTALDPDSLLDQPVAEFGATQMAPQDTSPVSLDFLEPCNVPGRLGRLGGYEILEVIGRGGMGIVLRAMDVKLNRVVAIKVLAPELASQPQARKRFLREAQAAAAVSHDHVVAIHAVDDGASGGNKVPLLVMECIVGQSLQEKIDKAGALGLKEILRIGMQIASGLAAAHKQGLVHRDIKPANILLENGVERVKITDFGLARATDDVGITQSGQIAGTPQYMSPEQAMGQPVDQRSDLFSLGSVLYTMCTGRPAFRADSAVAVLRRVCDDTPRPINEVNAEIPDWLVSIVNRLMAKQPEGRFQTAQEVATLLEQWLAHCQQPEAVAKPLMTATIASPSNSTDRKVANDSARSLLHQAWHEWWSERDRWVAISVQTVLILVYLACMVWFVSFGGSGGHDAEGRAISSYRLGAPTPWFRFDVNPEPNVAFRTSFNLLASSVLIGLVGCAAYYVYWRIEKVRNLKMSRLDCPAFMLGIWGIGALLAVGLGHWQGYAALGKPRVVVTQPAAPIDLNIDLNGVWDTSRPWQVEFTHFQIKPGMKSAQINGKCAVTDHSGGTGTIDATLDVASRTIEGAFNSGFASGRIRLVVSEDGNSIEGTYGWLQTASGDEPVTAHRWDMRRRSSPSGEVRIPQVGSPDATRHEFASDRLVAEWVLSILGTVRVNEGGLDLKTISELPREPFRLTAVDLRENPSVTTAGLASFAGCSHLSSLSISGPGLTSEGLAHFKGNANLTSLSLGGPGLTAAGLTHFGDCRNLTSLTLAGPGVTDAGLAHFREMRDLSQVILTGTHITDAGLPVLHTAQRLLQLNLEATDVTADGLNTLKQALPQCRIEWSGGIIEPTLHPAVAPFDAAQARHSQEAWAKHLGVEVERNNSIGMKLRLVPVGEFTMGTVPGAADRVAANPDWYFARWVRERRQAEGPPRVVRISQPAGWPGLERFAKPRGFVQSDSSPGHPVVAGCVIESNDHGWSDRAMMPSSSARTASHE